MDRREMLTSRRKHLTEKTRGHFWSQEEQRHGHEMTPEAKNNTALIDFIDFMQTSLESIEVEMRTKIESQLEKVDQAAFRYVDTRIEFSRASRYRNEGDAADYRERLQNADRSRRHAHNALMSDIMIALRMLKRATEDEDVPFMPPMHVRKLFMEEERHFIAHAAIDYVWEILDEEERSERTGSDR